MKKRTKLILATIMSLGIVSSVTAYIGNHRTAHMAHHIKSHLTKKLELTEMQAEKLDGIGAELLRLRMDMHQQRTLGAKQISTLLDSDSLNQEQAMTLVRSKTQDIEERAEQMIVSLASFTDSLDTEQRAKLKVMLEKRLSKRKHHKHGTEPS